MIWIGKECQTTLLQKRRINEPSSLNPRSIDARTRMPRAGALCIDVFPNEFFHSPVPPFTRQSYSTYPHRAKQFPHMIGDSRFHGRSNADRAVDAGNCNTRSAGSTDHWVVRYLCVAGSVETAAIPKCSINRRSRRRSHSISTSGSLNPSARKISIANSRAARRVLLAILRLSAGGRQNPQ